MLGVPCIERDAASAVRLYMLVAGCVREQRAASSEWRAPWRSHKMQPTAREKVETGDACCL